MCRGLRKNGGGLLASDHPLLPVGLAFLAAALWGLWWAPIRMLEEMGLSGAWGSVVMNLGAAAVSGAVLLLFRYPLQLSQRACAGAALVAVAVVFYSVALTLADVVRVILLFYLAPAWSKIIETVFMGQPWRMSATVALVASLTGAFFVLGGGVSLESVGFGDALAVLAGIAWAAGAALIFTGPRANPMALTFVTAAAGVVLGMVFIALGLGGGELRIGELRGVGLGLGFGAIYVLPILALTLWSAQRLTPAVLSFLLTAEILSGVGSSAYFLDEPFTGWQMFGATLVILAAVMEVVSSLRPARA